MMQKNPKHFKSLTASYRSALIKNQSASQDFFYTYTY